MTNIKQASTIFKEKMFKKWNSACDKAHGGYARIEKSFLVNRKILLMPELIRSLIKGRDRSLKKWTSLRSSAYMKRFTSRDIFENIIDKIISYHEYHKLTFLRCEVYEKRSKTDFCKIQIDNDH